MYKNILGKFGHRWIDEATLEHFKNLPDFYIVEVSFADGSTIGIDSVTGTERNLSNVIVYFKNKQDDHEPFVWDIACPQDHGLIERFDMDCARRYRMPSNVESRKDLRSHRELQAMRTAIKKHMTKVLAIPECDKALAGGNLFLSRNICLAENMSKLAEFIRIASGNGIDIHIQFMLEAANGDQLAATLNDLDIVDCTVLDEPSED